MKILFVGGGTLGPVMPLIATARALRRLSPRSSCSWIGTPTGPEAAIVGKEKIPFCSLTVAKLDRYPSWRWLIFPFSWARARMEAKKLVDRIAPDVVVTAGGYTAIPVVFAAVKRGIPCVTHQLDLEPVRTNEMIAKFCASVTTSFSYEHAPFGDRVHDEQIATPVAMAHHQLDRGDARVHFGLSVDRPVVFVFGGGTGAERLNDHVSRTLGAWLSFAQVIHVTGVGKGKIMGSVVRKGYVTRALIVDTKEMSLAYQAADLVICRAGMGALAEIAWGKKAAILIPLPSTHQEANAQAFEERGAAVVIDQCSSTFDDDVLTAAKLLFHDSVARHAMGECAHAVIPTDDGRALAERVMDITEKSQVRSQKPKVFLSS